MELHQEKNLSEAPEEVRSDDEDLDFMTLLF